jgi:hypothetical protein
MVFTALSPGRQLKVILKPVLASFCHQCALLSCGGEAKLASIHAMPDYTEMWIPLRRYSGSTPPRMGMRLKTVLGRSFLDCCRSARHRLLGPKMSQRRVLSSTNDLLIQSFGF